MPKLPVGVAREVALALNDAVDVARALNKAADEAMAEGAHEFDFTKLVQTSAKVRWAELRDAIDAALPKRKA